MALYNVRVKEDYRWNTARVSGREFTKVGEVMAEELLNEEIRNSELLEIKRVRKRPAKRAAPTPDPSPDDRGGEQTSPPTLGGIEGGQ